MGLTVGAWLELMWIDKAPMGNYVPPAVSYLSVITMGAVFLAGVNGNPASHYVVLALAFFLPLAYVGKKVDEWIFKGNEENARRAEELAKEGKAEQVGREHLRALARGVVVSTLFMVGASVLGALLIKKVIPYLPPSVSKAAHMVYYLFPPVMLGGALHGAYKKGDWKLIISVASLGGLVCFLIYGTES